MKATHAGVCTVYKYVVVKTRRRITLYQRQRCANKRDKDRFITSCREQLGSNLAAAIWIEP